MADPVRVVSMNLCTDQLAMMLAKPGQLVSVSYIARDPDASAMADVAQGYPINHGLAEEIYLLQPDLVVTGTFSAPATTAMLRRLGVPVAVFDPATSLQDVAARLLQMGAALNRRDAAEELVAEFEQQLAAFDQVNAAGANTGDASGRTGTDADAGRPRAALYDANTYTSGPQTLAGQILEAAGFANIASELGYTGPARLPLEQLVMAKPDMLVANTPHDSPARSEENLTHPVLRHLSTPQTTGQIRQADWVCGTPHVLRAIDRLAVERRHFTKRDRAQ